MNLRKSFLLIPTILFMYASLAAQNRSLGTITGIILDDGSIHQLKSKGESF